MRIGTISLIIVTMFIFVYYRGYMRGKIAAYDSAQVTAWKSVTDGCYTSPDGYCFSERHPGACKVK